MRATGALRASAALAVVLGVAACGPSAQVGTAAPASTSSEPATSSPAATTTASPSPSPTQASAPSPGTTLLSPGSGADVYANQAGDGFSVLTTTGYGSSATATLTTYDVAGNQLATAQDGSSWQCGAADVRSGAKRLVLGETVVSQPAQGINPALYSESLTAFDAASGRSVWTAQVVAPQQAQLSCGGSTGRDLQGFDATTDGAWGAVVVQAGEQTSSVAVDLATGKLYPQDDLRGAIGASLVTGRTTDSSRGLWRLTLPPTWQGLGSFSTGSDAGLITMSDTTDVQPFLFAGRGSNSSGAGLSSDGTLLFDAQRTEDAQYREVTVLTAYSLPGMQVVWRQDTSGQGVRYQLVGSGGSVLVATRTAVSGTTTEGLDARTGATLWTMPQVDDFCGLSTTQLLVRANGQLAVIDLVTGKQLSYSSGSTSGSSTSCPQVLPGGIAVSGGTVTQVLTP